MTLDLEEIENMADTCDSGGHVVPAATVRALVAEVRRLRERAAGDAKDDATGYVRRLRDQLMFPMGHTAPGGFLLVRKYDLRKLLRDYDALINDSRARIAST